VSNETSALAVTCKCGAAVFLAVKRGLDDIGMQEVSELIQRGCNARWMPLIAAREIPFGCCCGRETPEQSTATDCRWRHDDDDLEGESWYTDCGDRYVFTEGGPKENNHNYCHKCGKPVAVISGEEKPAERGED
jgi:hypothetical protein